MNVPGFFLALLFCMAACLPERAQGQVYDTASRFREPVLLDSYVVRSGFDVQAFIRRVKNDTTFYKAFKNLHFIGYEATNDVKVLGSNGAGAKASMHSRTRQLVHGHCRKTKTLEEHTTGDYYDRQGNNNYYTGALFAHLFFAKDSVCNESDIVAGSLQEEGEGSYARREHQLKQLIFNPGGRVGGIPFMGSRPSVFDEVEARSYDFSISKEMMNGDECYVFRIVPKSEYRHKVLYDELTTWFRKSDYSIIARRYSLSYSTLLYDFDVKMDVRTRQYGAKLIPVRISYDGNWHIFTRKREHVLFTVDITPGGTGIN